MDKTMALNELSKSFDNLRINTLEIVENISEWKKFMMRINLNRKINNISYMYNDMNYLVYVNIFYLFYR